MRSLYRVILLIKILKKGGYSWISICTTENNEKGLMRARSFLCSQSCVQFLRSNESAVLEAVGLVPSGESVEVFGEHGGANGIGGGNQCSAHYAMRSNSNPGVGAIQHAVGSNAAGALHHYPGAAHALKRRASDTPWVWTSPCIRRCTDTVLNC